MTSDGEVAIRQDGVEHAIDAPELDGQVLVCVDHGGHVELPPGVDVGYNDAETGDEIAADGGEAYNRVDVEMRGNGIDEEIAIYGLAAAATLLLLAGYLLSAGPEIGVIPAGGAAVLLAYLCGRAAWGDRS